MGQEKDKLKKRPEEGQMVYELFQNFVKGEYSRVILPDLLVANIVVFDANQLDYNRVCTCVDYEYPQSMHQFGTNCYIIII